MLILKLAWRNIWRNPRRSVVLILAVALGMFCVLAGIAYSDGLAEQMLDSSIGMEGGHIQVAKDGYYSNPTLRSVLPEEETESRLELIAGVEFAALVRTPGMIQSTEKAFGVVISGVEPDRERKVTTIHAMVVEGSYLTGETGEILVSLEMAERLNLRLGEKAVLLANDVNNDVSGGAYKIVGLFESPSQGFDRGNVFISLEESRTLVGYEGVVSAFSIRLDDDDTLDATLVDLASKLPGSVELLSWRDRNKALVLMMDAFDFGIVVFVVILFTAVIFTIVNSFLMVIFERIRELGVMMANGVHPRKIRLMLYAEAALMMLIGFAIGGIATAAFVLYYGEHGIDLRNFAEGLRSFGVGTEIFPSVNPRHFLMATATIVGMVLLGVLYPAFKASRFGVVEAINHV